MEETSTLMSNWLDAVKQASTEDASLQTRFSVYEQRFLDEIASLLWSSPYPVHLACQLTGFCGDDHIAWLEIVQQPQETVVYRSSRESNTRFRTLSFRGFPARCVEAVLFKSLPLEWRTSSHFGPEFMFGGESGIFWIKMQESQYCFRINFLEEESQSNQRLRKLLMRVCHFGYLRVCAMRFLASLELLI